MSARRSTRLVSIDDVRDLLASPPRCNVAWANGGAIEAAPAALRYIDGRWLIGMPAERAMPRAGDTVKVMVDDGVWFFDLRGAWVRGTASAAGAPADAPPGLAWVEVTPGKTVAWHYATLRASDGDGS